MALSNRINFGYDRSTGSFDWMVQDAFSIFSKDSADIQWFNFHSDRHLLCYKKYSDEDLGTYIVFSLKGCKYHHIYPWLYDIKLLDDRGAEFFTTKGRMQNCSCSLRVLTFVTESVVKEQYRGRRGKQFHSLTVRFSWAEVIPQKKHDDFAVPVKEPDCLLEELSSDFGSFYENRTSTDCVLKVRGIQFPVHRLVLSARSPVFAAMFYHDTSESRSGEVTIPDVDPSAFGDAIYYIYTGKIRGLTGDTAVAMYTVADKYALIQLREKCLTCLINKLTVKNVCDAALLAHTHGEVELEEKVVQFIGERVEELQETENWKMFLKTNIFLASKLLCSALIVKGKSKK